MMDVVSRFCDLQNGFSLTVYANGKAYFSGGEESVEVLNFHGQKIVYDCYGDDFVYDDGSEIEWGEVVDRRC